MLKQALRFGKRIADTLLEIGRVFVGIAYYLVTKKNTVKGYQSLIRLHCLTQGYSSEFIARLFRLFSPSPQLTEVSDSALGFIVENDLKKIGQDLQVNGVYVYEKKINQKTLDEIYEFALRTPAVLRRTDNDLNRSETKLELFDPNNPKTVRYDYKQSDLLKNPTIYKLAHDPAILAVAREYLGVEPILDSIRMWWHTDFQKEADSEAAQLYHFDYERVKWIKFFVYLTDVDEAAGPHCFVKKTHLPGSIPYSLLKRGYARIADSEVENFFSPDQIVEVHGPRGTLIAEDTVGLHKGKHILKGNRLALQFEYTLSMFGAPHVEEHFV